jgi:hypothetical protein
MAIGSQKIVINNNDYDITIDDLGVVITASGGSVDLLESNGQDEIGQSDDLLTLVASGTLQVSDGETDYSLASAVRFLHGIQPEFSFDSDGKLNTKLAENPIAYDKKIIVHSSPRPLTPKTYTHYMGRGDDLASALHGESDVQFAITCSGAYAEADFYFITDGQVYMRGAAFGWENCAWGVEVSAEMYSSPTLLYAAESGNFLKVNEYHRIYYDVEDGEYSFADNPVPVPALDANGNPVGYWDLSADGSSLVPNPTISGAYDLYDVEVQVARFVQKIPMYGTNYTLKSLESDDIEYMPPGYFMRMCIWNPEQHYKLIDGTYQLVSNYQPCRFWGYFFAYRESTLP